MFHLREPWQIYPLLCLRDAGIFAPAVILTRIKPGKRVELLFTVFLPVSTKPDKCLVDCTKP
jgi:hypothetical protein